MSKKMQQLLDLIVNEETEKANELFHEIVVERSREIYENLIAEEEDEEMDEASEEDDEEMDESAEEDDEEDDEEDLDENFGMDDDHGDDDEMGGDAADDMVGSVEVGHDDDMDDMGGEDGGAPATKDDVQDLEDALAELKAEFEALMGGEGGDDDMDDFGGEDDGEENPFGNDDEEDGEEDSEDDMDDEDDEEDDEEDESMESMGLREYRETVGNDWDKGSQKAQGVNIGGHTGENYPAPKDGASTVNTNAKATMPNSKANAKNIAQGGKGVGEMTGTSSNADKGSRGLVGNTQGEFTKGVTKNLANSAKAKMKDGASLEAVKKGHGAERKGTTPGPVGSGTGDKAGQTSDAQGAKKPFLSQYKK